MRASPRLVFAVLAAIAAVVLAVVLAKGDAPVDPLGPPSTAAADLTAADVVPYDGRSPREPDGSEVRVLIELRRPPLGALPRAAGLEPRLQRRHVASLEREGRALRSGLDARGIEMRGVVTFQRLWNGFAATIDGKDLPRLTRAGLRSTPVRRFYPAMSEPVPVAGRAPAGRAPAATAPTVAVLAGGPGGAGYDAVDGDVGADPGGHPADADRLERDGAALADLVRRGGRNVLPIRIAAQRPEEYARTDELLAGLERAVDPNGDGVTDDRARVALVGVSAPFAGFASTPEARAVAAARRLGLVVVAPAGQEGSGGTIGSPGGAPAAVTVGSLTHESASARLAVSFDDRVHSAAALAGAPPATLAAGPVVEAESAEALLRPDAPRLQGKLVLVRAGANPGAQAAAAEAAGAAAVLIAEPREGRSLPAIPAGRMRVPVIGVTGESAELALDLEDGEAVRFGAPAAPADADPEQAGLSRFSSTGPAPSGAPKPNQAAQAWADVTIDGRRFRVAGAAVAAARVAVAFAGGPRPRVLRGEAAGAMKAGRPLPAELGDLEVTDDGKGVKTVRFTVGAFERGDPPAGTAARLAPVLRLELALVNRKHRRVRLLTPPGGATDLLPGEYAYTLTAPAVRGLERGRYAFQARAWAPRQGKATVKRSATFAP